MKTSGGYTFKLSEAEEGIIIETSITSTLNFPIVEWLRLQNVRLKSLGSHPRLERIRADHRHVFAIENRHQ